MAVVSSCREMLRYVAQRAQPLSLVAIIKLGTLGRQTLFEGGKVGMTSSQDGPYGQGCTRTTMPGTEGRNAARQSKSQKPGPVQIVVCNSTT